MNDIDAEFDDVSCEDDPQLDAVVQKLVDKYYKVAGGPPSRDVHSILYEGIKYEYDGVCGGVKELDRLLDADELDEFEEALDYMERRLVDLHYRSGTLTEDERLSSSIRDVFYN